MRDMEAYLHIVGRRVQIGEEKKQVKILINQISEQEINTSQLLMANDVEYKTNYNDALIKEKIIYDAICDENEKHLPKRSYLLFLDAIESKLVVSKDLQKPQDLTKMVQCLRLFLASEQEYTILQQELKVIEKVHQDKVTKLKNTQDQLVSSQQDILHYQKEKTRLNDLIKNKTTEIEVCILRASRYKNLAIIIAIIAVIIPVIIIAANLAIEFFLLSVLVTPVLLIISCCLLASKVQAQNEGTSHQDTKQTATNSVLFCQNKIAEHKIKCDESSTMIPAITKQISDIIKQINDVNSRAVLMLEQVKEHKNQSRFFSFMPKDSSENTESAYCGQSSM